MSYYAGDPGDLVDAADALTRAILRRPAWHAHAACRGQDPALWFPEKGQTTAAGIAICSTCPVREECRAYALSDPSIDGIWAGTSKATRRAMRKSAA